MHCSRRRLLRRGLEFHERTINKSVHMKKVWKLIICTSYYLTHNRRIRRFISFPKGIRVEVKTITWFEFELTHYNVTVQHVGHYATSKWGSHHHIKCIYTCYSISAFIKLCMYIGVVFYLLELFQLHLCMHINVCFFIYVLKYTLILYLVFLSFFIHFF